MLVLLALILCAAPLQEASAEWGNPGENRLYPVQEIVRTVSDAGTGKDRSGLPFSVTQEKKKKKKGESGQEDGSRKEISEDGSYSSKEEVALYLHLYGHLPENYITRKQAEKLGWSGKNGTLWDYAPGKSIGGGNFNNYEGLLPEKKGRRYYECDIGFDGGSRGAERIVFSDDGLIYYTEDHFESFELLIDGPDDQKGVQALMDAAGVSDLSGNSGKENSSENNSGKQGSTDPSPENTVEEDGSYTSKEEVALYLHLYGHLPDNYITKDEAERLGWISNKGNMEKVAPGKSIGGSAFGNYEGNLPKKKGRKYYECDIDFDGRYRNAKRIVYSNDGLIYYTEDHYKTFELLYGEE